MFIVIGRKTLTLDLGENCVQTLFVDVDIAHHTSADKKFLFQLRFRLRVCLVAKTVCISYQGVPVFDNKSSCVLKQQSTAGISTESSLTVDVDERLPADEVYYSDDETDSSPFVLTGQPLQSSPSSAHCNAEVSARVTHATRKSMSDEEQQVVELLKMQMVLVNPTLTGNPALLHELAVNYLISQNIINATAVDVAQPMRQSPHQNQSLRYKAANDNNERPLFELVPEPDDTKRGSSARRQPSLRRSAPLLSDSPQLESGKLFNDVSPDGSSEYRHRNVGSAGKSDSRSEFDCYVTRGRGQSHESQQDSREVRPRGRGRGLRQTSSNLDTQIGILNISDDTRSATSRSIPLHPPAGWLLDD